MARESESFGVFTHAKFQVDPNLSWLGTGTKYAGVHTQWLGSYP